MAMRSVIALVLATLTAGTASSQPPHAAPPGVRPDAAVLLASALDVGGVHIVLQSTSLPQVQARLGGSVSRVGDAGVGIRSLCYYQSKSRIPWALWIQSSELYQGDVIHSFRLARLAPGAEPEAGCVALKQGGDVTLGAMLRLGAPREEVIAAFGPPVTETPNTLLFLRAGLTVIEDTVFSVQNRAFMQLEAGQVVSVEVSKSTSIAQ